MSGFIQKIVERHNHPVEIKPRLRMKFEQSYSTQSDQLRDREARNDDSISVINSQEIISSEDKKKEVRRQAGPEHQKGRSGHTEPIWLEYKQDRSRYPVIPLSGDPVIRLSTYEADGESQHEGREKRVQAERPSEKSTGHAGKTGSEIRKPVSKGRDKGNITLTPDKPIAKQEEEPGFKRKGSKPAANNNETVKKSGEVEKSGRTRKLKEEAVKTRARETLIRPKLADQDGNNARGPSDTGTGITITGRGRDTAMKNKSGSTGEKIIKINIGRIEIRAVKQSSTPRPAPVRPEQKRSSLNEYLKQRDMK